MANKPLPVGKNNSNFLSPPPKKSLSASNKRQKTTSTVKIFSPTAERLSYTCLQCTEIAEKHFCSVPCRNEWYTKWRKKTIYFGHLGFISR